MAAASAAQAGVRQLRRSTPPIASRVGSEDTAGDARRRRSSPPGLLEVRTPTGRPQPASGVRRVFCSLPFPWWPPAAATGKLCGPCSPGDAAEGRFIAKMQCGIVLSLLVTAAGLVTCLAAGLTTATRSGVVSSSDAVLPLALLVGLIIWLTLCRLLLRRSEARSDRPSRMPLVAQSLGLPFCPTAGDPPLLESMALDPPASTADAGAPMRGAFPGRVGSSASLIDRQSEGACTLYTAADLAAAASSTAFNDRDSWEPPRLPPHGEPRYDHYNRSLIVGFVLSTAQLGAVRLLQECAFTGRSTRPASTLSWVAYWLSCAGFTLVLGLIYSIVGVILGAYRQQSQAMRRYCAMLVSSDAQHWGLPYFMLNSTPNLDAFDAVRRYLLSQATWPNALLAVLEPTVAVMLVLILCSTGELVVRQLFDDLRFDNLSAWAAVALVVSFAYIGMVCVYANRMQRSVDTTRQVLAHVQWEVTRLWSAVLGELDDSAISEAKRERRETQVKRLWGLRAHAQGLVEICKRDPQYPRILGASLGHLRWGLILLQLVLNTTLFFAFRNDA